MMRVVFVRYFLSSDVEYEGEVSTRVFVSIAIVLESWSFHLQ